MSRRRFDRRSSSLDRASKTLGRSVTRRGRSWLRDVSDGKRWTPRPWRGSDHRLEILQRLNLDDVAGRLGLEHHLLAGEGIDALARLRGGLVNALDLHQAGHGEDAWT